MLEHQFIQFGAMPEIPTCDMPLPVGDGMQTAFFVQGDADAQIDIVTPDGILIKSDAVQVSRMKEGNGESIYQHAILQDISMVRPGACFRLKYTPIHFSVYVTYGYDDNKYQVPMTGSIGQVLKRQLAKLKVQKTTFYTLRIPSCRIYRVGSNGVPYGITGSITVVSENSGNTLFQAYTAEQHKDIVFQGVMYEGEVFTINAEFPIPSDGLNQTAYVYHSKIVFTDQYQGETVYSNLLQRVQPHKYAEVRYSCDEDAFGFPFSPLLADGTHPYLQLMLPIVLRKPQLKQTDKIYETLTGKRIVIYATINKEYEAQTEYIHEDWHEKNVIALCCDHIAIDGESLVRSESYEVNWDEYTETECGTKLAMATFKMQANINQRNSNHG